MKIYAFRGLDDYDREKLENCADFIREDVFDNIGTTLNTIVGKIEKYRSKAGKEDELSKLNETYEGLRALYEVFLDSCTALESIARCDYAEIPRNIAAEERLKEIE